MADMKKALLEEGVKYLVNWIKKTYADKDTVATKADKTELDNYATTTAVALKADKTELADYATKTELGTKANASALDEKVDKEEGKGLSTKDYTAADQAKVAGIAEGAQVNVIESVKVNGTAVAVEGKAVDVTVPTKVSDLNQDVPYLKAADIEDKVDKETGKGLSTNDLTDDLKKAYDKAVQDVKNLTATGGQANVIETISVNGTNIEPDVNKNVAISIPTKISGLTNDAGYLVASDIEDKVDKETGKGLSSNDYTTAEKDKLTAIEAGAQVNKIEAVKVNGTALEITDKAVNVDLGDYAKTADVADGYVAKEDGKGLSTKDYTAADQTKVAGIEDGAQVNVVETIKVDNTALPVTGKVVNIDLSGKVDKETGKGLSTNDLTNELLTKLQNAGTSNFSGKYTDLTGKPNIADEAMDAFEASAYATDLATIKGDYVTSVSLAATIAATGHIKFEFADELPAAGEANIIYFVKEADGEAGNQYAEYVFNAGAFEKVGVKKVDFSGVWSKDELGFLNTQEIEAIVAGNASTN